MRFNRKTHPALYYLIDTGIPTELTASAEINNEMQVNFECWKTALKSKVQCVTKPFRKALLSAFIQLQKDEAFKRIADISGTLIWGNTTWFYHIEDTKHYSFYLFHGRQLNAYYFRNGDTATHYVWPNLSKGLEGEMTDIQALQYMVSQLFTTLVFIKFGYIDVMEMDGSATKIKHENKEIGQCLNETGLRIEILTSHYFTTIHRTTGFDVTGHFRWQPYGQGFKDVKLIWINDFKKSGYCRDAGKLNVA